MPGAEASQRSDVMFRERVLPRASTFVVALSLVAMIAIAYGAAIDPLVGILIMTIVGIGIIFVIYISAPLIEVRRNSTVTFFGVGSARIEQRLGQANQWADPRILSAEELTAARRGQLDATAYLEIRSGLRAIAIDLVDLNDPHGMWVVSTRKPEELKSALTFT